MSRSISERQLRANRENGKKSTGPKSPEGKEKVRWNALEHGMCIRVIGAGGKRGAKLSRRMKRLLERIREDFPPQDVIDELFQEQIAVQVCRQAEVYRCERKPDFFDVGDLLLRYQREATRQRDKAVQQLLERDRERQKAE